MTIDSLGRGAAIAARHKATQEVDPTMMLEKLHRTHRTRTITMSVAGTAAAVIGIVIVVHGVSTPTASQPGGPGVSVPSDSRCGPTVQCLGGARYKVTDMPVPVTVNLPANFRGEFNKLGVATLEDYRSDLDQTGVTVFENAVPVRNDASWTRDPAAGTTAHSVATWLSQRPFLTNTTLTATTVGGRQAWLVTGDLKTGVPLLAMKDRTAAAPTFSGDHATAGYTPTLSGEYTLVDVPGAGVTVIWSWAPAQTKGNISENQAYVQGLSFG